MVTVIANLITEGQHCTIDASSSHSLDPNRITPRLVFRQGIIECGNKRLRILSTKEEGHADVVQLTEKIGCPNEVVGACDK
jgi:hypothetical protein